MQPFKSSLGFRGGCINNPGAIALAMDMASIAGSIFLGNGFSAEGQVRAIGANVGGSLYMDETRIIRPPRSLNKEYPDVAMGDIGKIIRFERIEIHGHMDLGCSAADKFFYAVGEVVLVDAQVDGRVSFDGASLSALNSGRAGKALDGDRMHIKGGLHFGQGFAATGPVSIANAQVGDSLLLGPATFIVLEGPAFDARGIHVSQDFIAEEKLAVYGSIILASAKIEGTLTLPTRGLSAPSAAAVDLLDARIRRLRITGLPRAGFLDLTKASVGVLLDDPESWPQEGRIVLNGLEYDAIHMSGVKFRDRRRWLSCGTRFVRASDTSSRAYNDIRFVPQPYERLALAYERVGEEYMRRRILCAKYRQRNRKASWRPTLGLSKVWNWVQDALIGYGYAPWRAFAWLLAILISGTLIFYFWIQPQPLHQGAKFTLPNAFLYTLDLLLPVFKLGEKSNWQTGQAGTVVGVLVVVTGWIFGATVVAAVTRVLKRR